jgi:hypothetical protein
MIMKLEKMTVGLAVAGVCVSFAAWPQQPTQPPPQGEPEQVEEPAQPELPPPAPLKTPPKPPEAPKNIGVEPSTADSRALTSGAASAEIAGDPQQALALAKKAMEADPHDPWPHYIRATALSRIGQVDDALRSFKDAEGRFAASDVWGRSVAIYGAAHALSEAGRCDEARTEFHRYAVFVRDRDPKSADMATRYAANCKAPAPEVRVPKP